MELLQYWKMARKWWWLILLSTLLCGAAGIFYAQRQTPIYTTTATLIINPAAPSALLPYTTDSTVQALASTYSEYMRTRSFAQLVATQMGEGISADEILDALSVRFVEGTQIFRITGGRIHLKNRQAGIFGQRGRLPHDPHRADDERR